MSGLPARDLEHILDATRNLWEELRGQRLFVTGGTGFLGRWLLESFCWANDTLQLDAKAIVLTRNLDAFKRKAPHIAAHSAIQFQVGDIKSFDFPSGEFSHIIHAAAETNLKANEKELLLVIDGIVNGTWHTLDFACHCNAKKVLLTSSGAIYGKQPSDIDFIPEDYKGAPDTVQSCSAYGHAKRFSESLCAMYADQFGIQTKIARCFAFMGPYMPLNASFAIGNFVLDGLRGEALRVKGDGSPYRSYMYAGDLAIWLWTILFKGKTCFPYNVGSDEAVTISDLADIVSQQFEQRPRIQIERANVIGLAGERYIPSIERARSELGLIPMIGLTEAVQRTIDWFCEIVNQPGENRCW